MNNQILASAAALILLVGAAGCQSPPLAPPHKQAPPDALQKSSTPVGKTENSTWLEHEPRYKTLMQMSKVAVQNMQFDLAERKCFEAMMVSEKFDDNGAAILAAVSYMVTIFRLQDRWPQVEEWAQKELTLAKTFLGPTDVAVVPPMHKLASAKMHNGKFQQAENILTEAIAIQKKQGIPDPETMAILYFRLGELDNFRKRYSEALLKFEDARRFAKESVLGDGSTLIQTDRAAAQSCFELGKFEKAKVYLNEAVNLVDLRRPPYEKIADMSSLAQCEAALSNDVQAEKIFKEAIDLGREQFVASKSNLDRDACRMALKYCHLAYADFLREHKRLAEANKVQAQARALEKAKRKIKKP